MNKRKHFNIVIQILEIFRSGYFAQERFTWHELVVLLRDPRYRWNFDREWWVQFQRSPHDTLQTILESLSALGLITTSGDREASSGFELWRIADTWRPLPPPGDGSGGDGAGVPGIPAGDGPGDGDEGGGGLRESLRHPVLFALPPEEFDLLADRLFTGEQA